MQLLPPAGFEFPGGPDGAYAQAVRNRRSPEVQLNPAAFGAGVMENRGKSAARNGA